jgi:hypothetical protein
MSHEVKVVRSCQSGCRRSAPARGRKTGDCACGCPAALLTSRIFFAPSTAMLETNPIHAQIADLRARAESLRGYL